MRMEESNSAKKVLSTKPRGNGDRRSGRLKLKWCDKLEEDVARDGYRIWRINGESREKQQIFNEEDNSHSGIYSQWEKTKKMVILEIG